jgi:hypothetical protein
MDDRAGSVSRSLWLIPEPAARKVLAKILTDSSRRLGTPRFEPHLTLLGDLPGDADAASAKAARLAARTAPPGIELFGVAHEAAYFRCVHFEARLSPPLRQARRTARRVFGVSGPDSFRPHVSAVYGKLRAAQRDRVARSLLDYVPMRFRAVALELVLTSGPPRDWRTIARFSLTARASSPVSGGARSRRS